MPSKKGGNCSPINCFFLGSLLLYCNNNFTYNRSNKQLLNYFTIHVPTLGKTNQRSCYHNYFFIKKSDSVCFASTDVSSFYQW